MQIRNTTARWGIVTQAFHWVIVALIITQVTLANIAEGLPDGLRKVAVLAQHKSVGITILMLATLRLLWRWLNPSVPVLPPTLNGFERKVARGTHYALYTLLFAMPLTGWMMSSARNFPVSWFGFFQLPDLVPPSRSLFDFFHETHELLATILIVLAVVHALAALRHHFWLKDDVLRRMLPFTKTPPRMEHDQVV